MNNKMLQLWRQGDVLIQVVAELPPRHYRRQTHVLFQGEASGHCHALKDKDSAEIYTTHPNLYLKVHDIGAEIIHPEHATIALSAGLYRVWQQREYVDAKHAPRTVRD